MSIQNVSPDVTQAVKSPSGPGINDTRPVQQAEQARAGPEIKKPDAAESDTAKAPDKTQDGKGTVLKALQDEQGKPLELSIVQDSDTKKWVIHLQDPETHETVRQIPAKELLELARSLGKDTKGAFVDTKA